MTPLGVAAVLSRLLKREVRMQEVPRADWEALFRAQGMRNPLPRMCMLDGFNEGWIEFEDAQAVLKGITTLETVLAGLVEPEAA